MLIRYSVENFLSFRDRVSFSMIPGKGSLKPNHRNKSVKGISTLKAGVVFGANASGKTNLIKAMAFGKSLIVRGSTSEQLINFQVFRLEENKTKGDTRMEYEIQHKGKNYAYGFIFNNKEIKEEWLYEISNKSDTKIFERNGSIYNLDQILSKNKKKEEKLFLEFTAKGTPNNRLFLTEIRTRKVKDNVSDINDLLIVLDWFINALKIVFPEDKYNAGIRSELKDDSKIQIVFEELLDYFDTGVHGVCFKEVDIKTIGFPDGLLEEIASEFNKLNSKSETHRLMVVSPTKETYFFSKKDERVIAEKFMTIHKVIGSESGEVQFDTTDESDGTNRIIDFIPLIIDLLQGDNVFVIDEMERSLHPNLIYDIFDLFLEKGGNINSQLIVASHESSLLTQKLLRKDEIWFVVKDKNGSSHIHSLEEYNVRFDKEIRKNYLLGRFKAIPRIGNRNKLTVLPNQLS